MKSSARGLWLRRLVGVLIGLAVVSQLSGAPVRAAAPLASTITLSMSDPACVEVLPSNGACAIEVNTLLASGSDPSFSRLEVLVNGKLRVEMAGFFESIAFLNAPMLRGGLRVACGRPNAGGKPNFGNAYAITANAYMVDGTSASDAMTVFCPAYDGKIFLPISRK